MVPTNGIVAISVSKVVKTTTATSASLENVAVLVHRKSFVQIPTMAINGSPAVVVTVVPMAIVTNASRIPVNAVAMTLTFVPTTQPITSGLIRSFVLMVVMQATVIIAKLAPSVVPVV